jgi:uncharacterized protein (DUF58 family)
MDYPTVNALVDLTSSSIRWLLRRLPVRRSIRLTSEGTRFLLFTFGIGTAAINTGNNLFYLLLAMMLSLIVISGLMSEHSLRRLEFRRHLPDLITAHEATTVTLSVINRNSHIPSFSLHLLDIVDGNDVDRSLWIRQLPPQRSMLLSYRLVATKRGWLKLDGIRVQTLFPFGLFLKRALFPMPSQILVGPQIKPMAVRFVDELVSQGQGQSLPRRGHGTELHNLRLYQPGDDSRTIHWMSTARTSQLIVRETEVEDQRRITIALSTVAPHHRDILFERAVALVASLAWELSRRSYAVRLIVGDADSGLGSGSTHFGIILRLLALCERRNPNEGETRFHVHHSEDGYLLAVIPWADPLAHAAMADADRLLDETQLEELTNGY